MKFSLFFPLLFALALALVSCQDNSSKDQSDSTSGEASSAATKGDIQGSDFVGMALEEAEALANKHEFPHRVVKVDGEPRPVTSDHRPERLNFEVEGGKVKKVTRG